MPRLPGPITTDLGWPNGGILASIKNRNWFGPAEAANGGPNPHSGLHDFVPGTGKIAPTDPRKPRGNRLGQRSGLNSNRLRHVGEPAAAAGTDRLAGAQPMPSDRCGVRSLSRGRPGIQPAYSPQLAAVGTAEKPSSDPGWPV